MPGQPLNEATPAKDAEQRQVESIGTSGARSLGSSASGDRRFRDAFGVALRSDPLQQLAARKR